jgi:hypothetical protein
MKPDASYGHNSGDTPPTPGVNLAAELVRIEAKKIDIKVVLDGQMHLLTWRRRAFADEVLVNNVLQQSSGGVTGRETVYGLVFGKSPEGEGGKRLLFTIDPRPDWTHMGMDGAMRLRGVRLESAEGVLCSYGALDPRELEKPRSFAEWVKKSMGISY